MSTLKQLRDQIVLENQSIIGDPYVGETMLNKWINDAQKFVQLQLTALGLKRWESSKAFDTELTAATLGGVAFKTITINSTNFPNINLEDPKAFRFFDVTHGFDSGVTYYGTAREVMEEDREVFGNLYMRPTIKDAAFMRLSGRIFLFPNTITAATCHYLRVAIDMATDAATADIPVEAEQFLIKRVQISIDKYLKKLPDESIVLEPLKKEIQEKYQLAVVKDMESKRKSKEGQTQ